MVSLARQRRGGGGLFIWWGVVWGSGFWLGAGFRFWSLRLERTENLFLVKGLDMRSSKKESVKLGMPQLMHSHVREVFSRMGQIDLLIFEHFL